MLSFKFFSQINERRSDPVRLAQRAARRYGTATSFGPWEKVPKRGHLPLTSFDEMLSGDAAEALYDFQEKLGIDDPNKKVRADAERKFEKLHKTLTVDIDALYATQPYVLTQDVDKLRSKISQLRPDHIHIIKYKGKMFISDGHHAVMAARLRGERAVSVKMIEI